MLEVVLLVGHVYIISSAFTLTACVMHHQFIFLTGQLDDAVLDALVFGCPAGRVAHCWLSGLLWCAGVSSPLKQPCCAFSTTMTVPDGLAMELLTLQTMLCTR